MQNTVSALKDKGQVLLRVHCTENPIYVFPEMKLRGLVPTSYIHEHINVEIGRQIIIILFWK